MSGRGVMLCRSYILDREIQTAVVDIIDGMLKFRTVVLAGGVVDSVEEYDGGSHEVGIGFHDIKVVEVADKTFTWG